MPPDEHEAKPWPWSEGDLIRLRHMVDAAEQIATFVVGRSRESLEEDDIAALGLVKAIEIIGEAAFALDQSVCDAIEGVPWPQLIGMRHRLVHAYFDVDLDIVWATATTAVPDLASRVRTFLNKWELDPTDL